MKSITKGYMNRQNSLELKTECYNVQKKQEN